MPAQPGIGILVFPADDLVLLERVQEVLAAGRQVNADSAVAFIEERLRDIYPAVSVKPRSDLAGFGQHAVYVFRDGSPTKGTDAAEWISDETTARVVSDATGEYLDANERAAALFGVASAAEIVGRRAGDFTRPDVRVDAVALWRALEATGRLHSLAVVIGPNAGRRVEFVTIRNGDGPGRNVTYLRELAVIDN